MSTPNLADEHNTVVCYDPVPTGAIVTILDSDGCPQLIAFDLEDLDRFASIAAAVRIAKPSTPPDERLRITPRGLAFLQAEL
jgi:hypothetical protein